MKYSKLICILCLLMLCSCSNKNNNQEKKPFGAEDINYEDIEKLGNEGPLIESEHKENVAPFSDMVSTSEVGPSRSTNTNNQNAPMADMDEEPDYGGIPIVTKAQVRDVEVESETNESE